MRFRVDLNFAPRNLGHDVVRVGSAAPPNAPDTQSVEIAARESRIIVTHDLDFSALVALSGTSGPSVVSLRLSTGDVPTVNQRLRAALSSCPEELAR